MFLEYGYTGLTNRKFKKRCKDGKDAKHELTCTDLDAKAYMLQLVASMFYIYVGKRSQIKQCGDQLIM